LVMPSWRAARTRTQSENQVKYKDDFHKRFHSFILDDCVDGAAAGDANSGHTPRPAATFFRHRLPAADNLGQPGPVNRPSDHLGRRRRSARRRRRGRKESAEISTRGRAAWSTALLKLGPEAELFSHCLWSHTF